MSCAGFFCDRMMEPSVVYEAIFLALGDLNKSLYIFDQRNGAYFGDEDGDIQCSISFGDGDFPMDILLSSREDIFEKFISEDSLIRDFTFHTQSLCIYGEKLGGAWVAVRNGEPIGTLRSEYDLNDDEVLKISNIDVGVFCEASRLGSDDD